MEVTTLLLVWCSTLLSAALLDASPGLAGSVSRRPVPPGRPPRWLGAVPARFRDTGKSEGLSGPHTGGRTSAADSVLIPETARRLSSAGTAAARTARHLVGRRGGDGRASAALGPARRPRSRGLAVAVTDPALRGLAGGSHSRAGRPGAHGFRDRTGLSPSSATPSLSSRQTVSGGAESVPRHAKSLRTFTTMFSCRGSAPHGSTRHDIPPGNPLDRSSHVTGSESAHPRTPTKEQRPSAVPAGGPPPSFTSSSTSVLTPTGRPLGSPSSPSDDTFQTPPGSPDSSAGSASVRKTDPSPGWMMPAVRSPAPAVPLTSDDSSETRVNPKDSLSFEFIVPIPERKPPGLISASLDPGDMEDISFEGPLPEREKSTRVAEEDTQGNRIPRKKSQHGKDEGRGVVKTSSSLNGRDDAEQTSGMTEKDTSIVITRKEIRDNIVKSGEVFGNTTSDAMGEISEQHNATVGIAEDGQYGQQIQPQETRKKGNVRENKNEREALDVKEGPKRDMNEENEIGTADEIFVGGIVEVLGTMKEEAEGSGQLETEKLGAEMSDMEAATNGNKGVLNDTVDQADKGTKSKNVIVNNVVDGRKALEDGENVSTMDNAKMDDFETDRNSTAASNSDLETQMNNVGRKGDIEVISEDAENVTKEGVPSQAEGVAQKRRGNTPASTEASPKMRGPVTTLKPIGFRTGIPPIRENIVIRDPRLQNVDIKAGFTCVGKQYGFYADTANNCSIFHVCEPVKFSSLSIAYNRYSFFCGETTVFDQSLLTCISAGDAMACSDSERWLFTNDRFGQRPAGRKRAAGADSGPRVS